MNVLSRRGFIKACAASIAIVGCSNVATDQIVQIVKRPLPTAKLSALSAHDFFDLFLEPATQQLADEIDAYMMNEYDKLMVN